MTERYKVWTSQRGRTFDTLEEAAAYRQRYFARTGYVVAVTAVKKRFRKKTNDTTEPPNSTVSKALRNQ